jgi:hypothetical protein
MKILLTLLSIALVMPLMSSNSFAANHAVIACPAISQVELYGSMTFHKLPNEFEKYHTSARRQAIKFKQARRSRGQLVCDYTTEDRHHPIRVQTKKKSCTQYSTGWNSRGTVCSASNPANCRAICP